MKSVNFKNPFPGDHFYVPLPFQCEVHVKSRFKLPLLTFIKFYRYERMNYRIKIGLDIHASLEHSPVLSR